MIIFADDSTLVWLITHNTDESVYTDEVQQLVEGRNKNNLLRIINVTKKVVINRRHNTTAPLHIHTCV